MSPTSLPSSAGDGDRDVPDLLAGVAVEADQVRVERRHVEPVAPGGEPAVDGVAAERQVLGERLLVVPELGAGLAIDRVGVVPGRGHVHDAVDDQRRAFEAVEHARLERPDGDQPGDVPGVDLVERAVPLGVVGAAVHQPVGVVGAGLQEVVVVDGPDRLGGLTLGVGLAGAEPPARQARPGDEAQREGDDDAAPVGRAKARTGWCDVFTAAPSLLPGEHLVKDGRRRRSAGRAQCRRRFQEVLLSQGSRSSLARPGS